MPTTMTGIFTPDRKKRFGDEIRHDHQEIKMIVYIFH